MLYNDRTDIGPVQLEKIIQGIVWLADGIVMPAYARPSPALPLEEQRRMGVRLAELAEAGYLHRWSLDPAPPQVRAAGWWPASTATEHLDMTAHEHLQRGVRAGVAIYRDDLLRGVGKPANSMISGISEFVSLQDSLWTLGLARFLDTDCLLSSDNRSMALSAPMRRLAAAGTITGPVTSTIMEMHEVGSLLRLSVSDIKKLSRYKPATRALIADVVTKTEDNVLDTLDYKRFIEAAVESSRRQYVELLGDVIQRGSRRAGYGQAMGLSVSIAGTIFPPLGALSFVEPVLSWDPRGRTGRRFIVFLTKLRKRTSQEQTRQEVR
jgi:hypothetical protein